MKYEKLMNDLSKKSFYNMLIENGVSPEEIKKMVIETFKDYFENEDILEELAMKALLPEMINFMRIKDNSTYFNYFKSCFNTLKKSKDKDAEECFKAVVFWDKDIDKSLSKFWSFYYLENKKSDLRLEELVNECFDNIGKIIEGILTPFSNHLLHQFKISQEEIINPDYFENKSLGDVLNELVTKTDYGNLFIINVVNIDKDLKLNKWRNIAYHHNYYINEDEIVCELKYNNKVLNSFSIDKDLLLNIVEKVYMIFMALKLSYVLFFVDNIKDIKQFGLDIDKNIREEMHMMNFIYGIESQGFKLLDFIEKENEAKAVIQDIMNSSNDRERMIHCSQFLFYVWFISKNKDVFIEYVDKNENHKMLFRINGDICKKVYKGELELSDQAKYIVFRNLEK